MFYNLANQIDHFAQRFICDSFGLEDLIKLINSHSSRIDDILIDFRYLTIIYITYKSSVVQDKLIKLNKSVDEFRMLSHSPEIFVKDFFTDLRKEITATFNELQVSHFYFLLLLVLLNGSSFYVQEIFNLNLSQNIFILF